MPKHALSIKGNGFTKQKQSPETALATSLARTSAGNGLIYVLPVWIGEVGRYFAFISANTRVVCTVSFCLYVQRAVCLTY